MRIAKGITRGRQISFTLDGEPVVANEGESIAAALLAAGRPHLRNSPGGAPRGAFCMMGVCQECVVTVDGGAVRACRQPVREGLAVQRRMFADEGH